MSTQRVILATAQAVTSRPALGFRSHRIELSIVGRCADVIDALWESPRADAVVTHVSLPDGNWRDVVDQVRQVSADMPVIVLAQRFDAQLWLDATECGVADVVQEPRTTAEFGTLIDLIRKEGRHRE